MMWRTNVNLTAALHRQCWKSSCITTPNWSSFWWKKCDKNVQKCHFLNQHTRISLSDITTLSGDFVKAQKNTAEAFYVFSKAVSSSLEGLILFRSNHLCWSNRKVNTYLIFIHQAEDSFVVYLHDSSSFYRVTESLLRKQLVFWNQICHWGSVLLLIEKLLL